MKCEGGFEVTQKACAECGATSSDRCRRAPDVLMARLEDIEGRFNQCSKNYKELAALWESAQSTIKAIEPYIRHKKSCRSNSFLSEARCGCGFKELKALLEETTP